MKNIILTPSSMVDIDKRVQRVISELGNPEPPLELDDVRELLRLDREYFTAGDPSVLRQVISKLKVAGQQILLRPSLLLDAVKKCSLKALYLPDRKRIILDSTRPQLKQRWDEAHEIGHSLLPWHLDMMLGDDASTLAPAAQAEIEAEANFAAGQLLFFRSRFVEEARGEGLRIRTVQTLKESYGNTLTTTLWRLVEVAYADVPCVGIVSSHPHYSRRPDDFDPNQPCKYTIQSPEFAKRFGAITEPELFAELVRYCGPQKGGPLGRSVVRLRDNNGDQHQFEFETFFNQYDALTLGVWRRPVASAIFVPGNYAL